MNRFVAESANLETLSQPVELYELVHDIHDVLDEAGIPHAVMSGLHAAVLQEAATGAPHRVTNDGDLWIPDNYVEQAAEVLDTQNKGFEVSYFSGTDRSIVTVHRDAEAELMANMDVQTPDGVFAFRMTPYAQANMHHGSGRWNIPFVRSEDSIILKALLQRTVGKHDAADIQALHAVEPINRHYLLQRMHEINLDTDTRGLYERPVQQRIMPYLASLAITKAAQK
jgi:hypothetical protein